MKKIRTLIAHNDVNITNDIVKAIENLEYVDIVGTAKDGKETYNKIIDLKPEMVFAKYNMENMNGFEIAKSSKEKLENNVPIFNMIIDNNVKEEEIDKVYDMIGNKLNSLITEPISNNIVNIINDYKEYKNSSDK